MVPISLELKNFFSHKDSFVDFSLFDSALLIGNTEGNYDVSNGCGKSAVFEGILWCLFNKSRAASMDDVIFWGEAACKVIFIFKHGGEIYRVTRKRYRSGNTSFVEFSKQDPGGCWVDISGSTPSLTNDEIIKTIRFDYKTFVNSAYFRQNDISEFTETDASRKKEILKSIIDISKWDEYEDQIKSVLKDLKSESKILESKFEDLDELAKEHLTEGESLEGLKLELQVSCENRDLSVKDLEKLTISYQDMKSKIDTTSWDKAIAALKQLANQKNEAETKIKSCNKGLEEYLKSIKDKEGTIFELNKKISEIIIDEDVDEKVKKATAEQIEFKASLAISKEMLKNLNNRVITKDSCYVCQQNISEDLYSKLHTDHTSEIEKHNKNIIFCQNKTKELDAKMQSYEESKSNKKKAEAYASKIDSLSIELKISKERWDELDYQLKKLQSNLTEIDSDIELNKNILESLRDESFKALQLSIHSKKESINNLNVKIEKLNHDIGGLSEKLKSLKARIDEKQEHKNNYVEKQKRVTIYEKMVKLLGKNGIQTILLNAIIEDLEKTANDILQSICNEPFQIFLDTQRIGSDGISVVDTLDLRVKKEGIIQNFKSLSGGEQFRISLALRIALSEISSRHGGSALEFLLLDEINSPLDKQGTESLFINVIKSLERKYKILVITHNDSLKERFTSILDITKINGESTINYITA